MREKSVVEKPLVLALHNSYLVAGGEDQSFMEELKILRENGHRVYEYVEDNKRIESLGRIRTALRTIWSTESYNKIISIHKKFPFDIMYVQNFFPLLSPSVYYAAFKLKVPVIQFLRNYRLMCLNGTLFRQNKICELCVGKFIPFHGIKYRCYRESLFGSLVVSTLIGLHKLLGTWRKKVTYYIVLTDFARKKFIEGGFPPDKILIKPNFVFSDYSVGLHNHNFALYAGRLSPEKGIMCMIEAFKKLPEYKLKIIGDGPLKEKLLSEIVRFKNIEYLGKLSNERVIMEMKIAKILIFPSGCYEGMPRSIIESFSVGLPVIASDLGSMSSMIVPLKTGLHFQTDNSDDLVSKITWIFENPEKYKEISINARKEFDDKYSAGKNYLLIKTMFDMSLKK